ncbi:protein of unknown function [Mesorhizobium albiziae]|uniref:DUF1330 domain-containing protein n=1 Tax=Neomesorhizobium albiziae TaxID=335020 RepID=A0A1I3Z168_9HYPH|nr:DUF1330 domain-containing protein [Mesorhizobium albiziae]GLS33142.1 hypothetical protein GCM10007937_48530 [Mesorhizobium albiziae]SFK37833.1 protein of unknown function [Mesorhizobium albiziae]
MVGHIDPTREKFGAFRALPDDGPVHMLNLIRLRDRAEYADGREASGAQAYAAYGRESVPVFRGVGGRIAWSGDFRLMLIGPETERWDICFIAEYPSAAAFIAMVKDPEYQKAVIHRQAAVADSRLIRMAPKAAGAGFGE